MKFLIPAFLITTLFFYCDVKVKYNPVDLENAKKEILETEKNFEKLTMEKGLAESFYFYADEKAVLNRGNSIIQGKDHIRQHYSNSSLKNISLKWDPEFVDVANSGELAYTFGKYTFTAIDSTGKSIDDKGIFHTVWKKQKDGNWKFVWD